jgi:hypothetical protein
MVAVGLGVLVISGGGVLVAVGVKVAVGVDVLVGGGGSVAVVSTAGCSCAVTPAGKNSGWTKKANIKTSALRINQFVVAELLIANLLLC